MTTKEMIEILRYKADNIKTKIEPEFFNEVADKLEKQVAKNPYLWGDGYYNGELIIDMYDCPNCERTYEIECDDYKYCPNCGQKLDWSEVE